MAEILEKLKIPFLGSKEIKESKDISLTFYSNGRMHYNIAFIIEREEEDSLGIKTTYDDMVLQSGYMWLHWADVIIENMLDHPDFFDVMITNGQTSFKFIAEDERKAREYAEFINQFIENAKEL